MAKTQNTQGFYNPELIYAPNAVYFSDGTIIVKEDKDTYIYPVNDWRWFDYVEDAYTFYGKEMPKKDAKLPKIKPQNS